MRNEKYFQIKKDTLEQLAQKQMEEMNEELLHLMGLPDKSNHLHEDQQTFADLFSSVPYIPKKDNDRPER
ncbi:hypothetical protein DNHGIG_28030 [Collibacillus ludicampi]|jgi:hypothetical protein|uniref:Uncharacterized protein n=1 Tax=Collibacillus ludicampi TaxID=2771369 RepID=A0AAV4LHS4_9BACL|nr:hypothetical protein [Collibacillus ludicampi]GIM47254.1 hypothetical protein DNHGIG_28030 [Collibacillus ludicampi]